MYENNYDNKKDEEEKLERINKLNKSLLNLSINLDKINGGDGKCHIIEREDEKREYSGPMTSEDIDKMFIDPNSVLVL